MGIAAGMVGLCGVSGGEVRWTTFWSSIVCVVGTLLDERLSCDMWRSGSGIGEIVAARNITSCGSAGRRSRWRL